MSHSSPAIAVSNGVANGDHGANAHKKSLDSTTSPFEIPNHTIDSTRNLHVVVIGAGLVGILAGILLPAKVPNITLTILEKNAEVGGTWYENTYPGVRCDIPAHVYQSTFAPNTQWSEEFATGPEILRYWKDLAQRYEVYKYLRLRQQVNRMDWDDELGKWRISATDLEKGEAYDMQADVVLPAIGRFNDWRLPDYPGMGDFKGLIRHTSNWDTSFEPEGKRIAIIGNGASGIQLVPALQKVATRLDHYARSRTWIARSWAGDVRTSAGQPFTREQLEAWKDPASYLAHRKPYEDKYWRGMAKAYRGSDGNAAIREDAMAIMAERLSKKPELIDRMIPDFSPNCRRPTPGPGYLEALCEDNVEYIETPIAKFTATGIETSDGVHREVDAAFCATGANVDLVPPFSIVSRGVDLRVAWKPGGDPGFPHTYMGIAAPGFPNLFWLYGPQAGGLSGTVPHVAENQIAVAAKLLRKIGSQGVKAIEPKKAATDDFAEYSEAFFKDTVLTDPCRSWYNGGVKGGRVHGLWPGSAAHLTAARKEPRWEDWDFAYANRNRFAYLGNGWTDMEKEVGSDITNYLKMPEEVNLRTLHE